MNERHTISSCLLEVTRALTESYTYEYKMPKSREKRLYDFYLFTLYHQMMNTPHYEKRLQTLPGMDEDTRLDLEEIVTSGAQKLADETKDDLLDALVIAVASEFRHIESENDNEKIKKFMDERGALDQFSKWMRKYRSNLGGITVSPDWARKSKRDKGQKKEYEAAYRAVGKSEWPVDQFMDVAADAFTKLEWAPQYGGKAWADIARSWYKLKAAQSLKEKQLAIDHVFDLEHNSGTMLNKVKRFAKKGKANPEDTRRTEDMGFTWIKKALDAKFNMTPIELARKSSLPMSLVGRLNRLTGAAQDSVEEHDKKKLQSMLDKQYPHKLGSIPVEFNDDNDRWAVILPKPWVLDEYLAFFNITSDAISIQKTHQRTDMASKIDDDAKMRSILEAYLRPSKAGDLSLVIKDIKKKAKEIQRRYKNVRKDKLGPYKVTVQELNDRYIEIIMPDSFDKKLHKLLVKQHSKGWRIYKLRLGDGYVHASMLGSDASFAWNDGLDLALMSWGFPSKDIDSVISGLNILMEQKKPGSNKASRIDGGSSIDFGGATMHKVEVGKSIILQPTGEAAYSNLFHIRFSDTNITIRYNSAKEKFFSANYTDNLVPIITQALRDMLGHEPNQIAVDKAMSVALSLAHKASGGDKDKAPKSDWDKLSDAWGKDAKTEDAKPEDAFYLVKKADNVLTYKPKRGIRGIDMVVVRYDRIIVGASSGGSKDFMLDESTPDQLAAYIRWHTQSSAYVSLAIARHFFQKAKSLQKQRS